MVEWEILDKAHCKHANPPNVSLLLCLSLPWPQATGGLEGARISCIEEEEDADPAVEGVLFSL